MSFALALSLATAGLTVRAAEETNSFKDFREKLSYGIGMNIGSSLKRGGFDVDLDLLVGALRDAAAGNPTKLTEQQCREILTENQKIMSQKREEERKKTAEKNRKAGEEFLTQNKAKSGVKLHEVKMPDGTTAELQYKVITEGTGATPGTNDIVSVNYRGTLIDGKEFDNSAKGGKPAEFPVNRVIRGWTEALKLMKVGSKWEVYIPSQLAYGDFGKQPTIEPGSTLVFEMELVDTKAPTPPPAPAANPQSLTSDIIRVPSADELKKGAKIEVLKPEEAERRAKEEAEKNKQQSSEKK